LLSNNEEKTAIGQEDNERKNEDTKEAEKQHIYQTPILLFSD
jgi:hypothetical protein